MIDKDDSIFFDSVLAGESIASLKLNMGDEIRIYSTDEVEGAAIKHSKISGYVKRPGYTLFKDLDIKNLLFWEVDWRTQNTQRTFITKSGFVSIIKI